MLSFSAVMCATAPKAETGVKSLAEKSHLTNSKGHSQEIISLQKQIHKHRRKAVRELAFPDTRRIGEARLVMAAAMEDVVELLKARAGHQDN